jgi:hypothetical protein
MAWTTPRTWVTSELVTAALMNTHLRDNLTFLLTNIPNQTVASITSAASPFTAAGSVVILGDTSGGNITVNLPAAAANTGKFYYIKNTGTGTVTVDGNGSETVEGETTQQLLQGDCALIVCDGSNWHLI